MAAVYQSDDPEFKTDHFVYFHYFDDRTLQLFDEVQNITGGGPANATTTLSQYIYNLSYKFTPNFGYAAAVSFVNVAFIVILSIIQTKVGGESR